jgi:hypothetical protein
LPLVWCCSRIVGDSKICVLQREPRWIIFTLLLAQWQTFYVDKVSVVLILINVIFNVSNLKKIHICCQVFKQLHKISAFVLISAINFFHQ